MPQTVASFLSHQIQSHGPLRFDQFMNLSLYQQDIGYYSSGKTRTGSQGDFLTPVSTGPVLGQLLSLQISEFAKFLNHPPSLHIVEQGADRGHLAHDILTSLLQDHPHLNSSLQLHLIEPSPPLAQQQKKLLQPLFSKIPIHWHSDISLQKRPFSQAPIGSKLPGQVNVLCAGNVVPQLSQARIDNSPSST